MIRVLFAGIISLSFISNPGRAQSVTQFSEEDLREDFYVFEQSLKDFHPGLYWHLTPNELKEIFTEVVDQLEKPMTEREFYSHLAFAASQIGCGHTGVWLSSKSMANSRDEYFPWRIRIESHQAFFIRDYANTATLKPGTEILALNGIPMDSLIRYTLDRLPGDGLINTGKYHTLNQYFYYTFFELFGQPQNFEAVVQLPGGPTKIELNPISQDIIGTAESDENPEKIRLGYNPDSTIAILKITSFFNWKLDGKTVLFNKRLQGVFDELNERQIKKLLIDVRDNGGGKEPWRLFAYLHDEPFTFARSATYNYSKESSVFEYQEPHRWMKFLKRRGINKIIPGAQHTEKVNDSLYSLPNLYMVKEFKPLDPYFGGEVVVLINGGSFSATALFTAKAKSENRAIFVGEETGGGYYGNTSMSPTMVTLPNTGIRIEIPLVRFQTDVNPLVPDSRGTPPDYEVRSSIMEILEGKDPQMDFGLELLGEK